MQSKYLTGKILSHGSEDFVELGTADGSIVIHIKQGKCVLEYFRLK